MSKTNPAFLNGVPELLVLKLLSPDTLATRAVAEWVTALDHELSDDAMENSVVIIAVACMGGEVLDGLRSGGREEP